MTSIASHASVVAFRDAARRSAAARARASGPGKYAHSCACGYGVSQPVTRSIGASRWKKQCSCTSAASSAPKPLVRVASWTITQRPVFRTEPTSVSRSSGQRLRRSMISASMPVSRAAASATHTIVPYVRTVTAAPGRTMAADSSGTV